MYYLPPKTPFIFLQAQRAGKGKMIKKDNGITQSKKKIFKPYGEVLIVNDCKIILNFLPKSNSETIDTVKKILVSSQHQDIPYKAGKAG